MKLQRKIFEAYGDDPVSALSESFINVLNYCEVAEPASVSVEDIQAQWITYRGSFGSLRLGMASVCVQIEL
ncbi:hypothetical protein [Streptomyces sp. 1222.5]|uniref:hypothetical protein n=1 Tax=Streptomyces sp. 1222.5 TaxID=1881026 RepID=UPI003EB86799